MSPLHDTCLYLATLQMIEGLQLFAAGQGIGKGRHVLNGHFKVQVRLNLGPHWKTKQKSNNIIQYQPMHCLNFKRVFCHKKCVCERDSVCCNLLSEWLPALPLPAPRRSQSETLEPEWESAVQPGFVSVCSNHPFLSLRCFSPVLYFFLCFVCFKTF